ncbi:MAG: CDP-glycerol glycerophosphotransferase family protein [Lachnospiraceae bacterium]|nr:CDP-glycerol glycerophosphotransferase family protein [Lachnospiraceae bacterium]
MKGIKVIGKYFVMYLSMLMPRNKKLCVFGAWLGERFADNSKQLFIEACDRKNLRAVWITKSESVLKEIHDMGYEAYMWGTPKAVWTQLRAGYAIVSNGISDLEHTFLGRSVIIDLWHGIPLKKVVYDNKYEKDWDSPKQKLRDKLINVPLGKMYFVAPSEMFIPIYQSAFRRKREQIICLGQPRSDIFFADNKPDKYFPDKKIILYCPTHRNEGAERVELSKIFDLERLEKFLDESGYYFVIKKHFYHRMEVENLEAYPHIIDITNEDMDIQRLIMETEILITDYSSIYIDYLLLDSPLLFYCYDYEHYLANDREMYFEYEDVTPGVKAKSFDELLGQLKEVIENGDSYGKEDRERVKNMFYCKKGQGPVGNILLDMIENGSIRCEL